MLTALTLALAASLLLSAQATAEEKKQPPTAPLYQTEAQAIALAFGLADGKSDPMTIDFVNKAARYIGKAVVEIEKTTNFHGGLLMLAGLRFVDDGRLAWTASWIAPFEGASLARGA